MSGLARVAVVAVLGLVALEAGLAVLLSSESVRYAGTNDVGGRALLTQSSGTRERVCQVGELLPRDTSTIRLSLQATGGPGPALALTASRHGTVLTRGTRAAGWKGQMATIPVRWVAHSTDGVRICVTLGRRGAVNLRGGRIKLPELVRPEAELDGTPVGGRVRIEYLKPGRDSWWSYAGTVLHRMGLGRAWPGAGTPLLAWLLMAAAATCALGLLIREQAPRPSTRGPPARFAQLSARIPAPLRRIPTAGWICALVALLNAMAWALITPAFQVPDENDHFAYVQQLAETGRPPYRAETRYSPEETQTLHHLRFRRVANRHAVGIWSTVEQRELDHDLNARPGRLGPGASGVAMLQPPLYFALEAIPYRIAEGGSLLERLTLMRMLSALMGALTALLAFLFVRETLPAAPWAWSVGGLAFALGALFGHMSGGVNPDSLLFLSSTALFYCVARAFRRGLSLKLSLAVGVVLAVGLLGKLTFVGLLPGAAIGFGLVAIRQVLGGARPWTLLLPVLSAAIALVPVWIVAVLNTSVWGRPAVGAATGGQGYLSSSSSGTVLGYLNYTWQFFLPPLPGMPHDFAGVLTTQKIWYDGFVGLFGWINIRHPDWVYDVAVFPAAAAMVLGYRGMAEAGPALRRRIPELLVYAVMLGGLAGEVGLASYSLFLIHAGGFGQSRYLLPLGALFAAAVALMARGGGKRWGPAVGVLIVLVVLAHDVGSQLLVISEWYA